jgi:hypothetical protein
MAAQRIKHLKNERNGFDMAEFVQENTHSNIIIVNIPPRLDIGSNSVTNLEIQTANGKLNRIAKAYNNVTIVESNLHRKYFT